MDVLGEIGAVRRRRQVDREHGLRVALVPTMGFLHDGHLSLVRRSIELADSTWVSVFVNPTQFGPDEDLDRYPRDLDRDLRLLEETGADVVFVPTEAEIYPRPPVVSIRFGDLERPLCGSHRPGHFAGVGLVVAKLFHLVEPDVAVFGQKDAQQALLIRRLVDDLDFPVAVEVAPTVREPDGLAMSSRNALLEPGDRSAATVLYRSLERARDAVVAGERDPSAVTAVLREEIAAEPRVRLEYAEVVGADDLVTPAVIERPVLLAVAARVGATRLIDNIPVDPDTEG